MPTIETFTGGIAATNSHLLILPTGALLVDAPEGVATWVKQRGLPIAALLLTHQHFDHVLDAAAIQEQHGCPIYAWAEFSRDLTLERLFGAVTGSSFEVQPFQVNEVLQGRSEMSVCGESFKLLHIPGHSPDSVCFHLEREELLFGGDVLFEGSIGRTDFPGGSSSQLISGIQRLLWVLPESTRVLPGHGEDTTIATEKTAHPFAGLRAHR